VTGDRGLSGVGRLLGGLAGLLVFLLVLAVSAAACEGGGGPPTSPTAAEQYGPNGNPGVPKLSRAECGAGVDCATGNEAEQQIDLDIAGRGPGLRVVRNYNGLLAAEATKAGPWGYGWTGSYDASLVVSGETATVRQDNGSVVVFYKSGSEYTQGGWDEARLVKEGTNYIYTLPDQTKLEFNSSGQLVKETERRGNSNSFTYNGSKQLEKVTDGAGRTLTFKYNVEGLVESVEDPMKHVISYTYSSENLASVTIEGVIRWKFEYETPHLLKKITDGLGHSLAITYDGSHRVKTQTVGGHERKWTYGSTPGTETTLNEPNTSETFEKFNSGGEPTKVTLAKGTGIETTTEYEYNASTYNITKLIDPNKHETTYGYDGEGNLTKEVDPNKDETTWEYDKKHNIIKETSPESETTTIKRTASGEPQVVERPVGSEIQKTEYEYDADGDLSEETDPLKHTTKYTYDTYGDVKTITDPEKNETVIEDNEDSDVTKETTPRGYATEIEVNEQGLPKKIKDPLKHVTSYTYNGADDIESVTDGNKNTTTYEYNEENLPIKVGEPDSTVKLGYDSEGELTSRIDGNNNTWEYIRNKLEQVTEEKNPLGKITKKKYEKAGDLESVEDPEKNLTEFTYDESNRPKKIKYSTGKPSEATYEYNKDSLVKKMTDGSGTTENTWNKLDLLEKYKNGAGKTVEYKYNLDNEPTKIIYPNGKSITRGYDSDGRLESVTDWNGGSTTFKYNSDSELEKTIFPPASEDEDTYGYNEADQLKEVTMQGPLGATLGKLVYERDENGQVKKTTTTTLPGPATSEDKYDGDNRLTEDNKQAYKYDDANNPTELAGAGADTYNEADQIKEGPEAKYAFNEDGQRVKTEPKSGEPATTYSYDQAGNLTSVERLKGTKEPEIKDSYTYDGNDLRQTQTINGAKTNLTWDTAEETPLVLNDETDNYIYGPENLPIEQIATNTEETTLYIHHDQQGSTRMLTNTKGKSEAEYAYNPYGSLFEMKGSATTPLLYDGQYTNTNAELVYVQGRTFDPKTGQFLSLNPALAEAGGPYGYAGDNPLNASNPSGEQNGGPPPYVPPPPFVGPELPQWSPITGVPTFPHAGVGCGSIGSMFPSIPSLFNPSVPAIEEPPEQAPRTPLVFGDARPQALIFNSSDPHTNIFAEYAGAPPLSSSFAGLTLRGYGVGGTGLQLGQYSPTPGFSANFGLVQSGLAADINTPRWLMSINVGLQHHDLLPALNDILHHHPLLPDIERLGPIFRLEIRY
jgi:RHS repeat-associated protein